MLMALQRLGRDRIVLLIGVVSVAAIGWLVLAHMSASTSPGTAGMTGMLMPHPQQAPTSDYGMVLAMWVVMMVAMMAPAAGPGASAYLTLARRRHPEQSAVPAAMGFFIGYLAAWFGYAVLGAAAQSMLARATLLSPMGVIASAYLCSGILIAAGAYQLIPLKRICLARCRNPLLQLMGSWRDGTGSALRLGFRQGRWCVGCCWALMVLMFVIGVMNLAWMAILAAFILVEKLVPVRWHLDTVAGLLFVAWGAWLFARVFFADLQLPN